MPLPCVVGGVAGLGVEKMTSGSSLWINAPLVHVEIVARKKKIIRRSGDLVDARWPDRGADLE